MNKILTTGLAAGVLLVSATGLSYAQSVPAPGAPPPLATPAPAITPAPAPSVPSVPQSLPPMGPLSSPMPSR